MSKLHTLTIKKKNPDAEVARIVPRDLDVQFDGKPLNNFTDVSLSFGMNEGAVRATITLYVDLEADVDVLATIQEQLLNKDAN